MTVDDKLPFLQSSSNSVGNENRVQAKQNAGEVNGEVEKGQTLFVPLFPMTSNLAELWPALLFKAILKVVSLE